MNCSTKVVENVTIFSIDGNIVFNNLVEIREKIKAELDKAETENYMVNLSGVGIIDSAGVGFIVSVYKTVLSKKGNFSLVGPNDAVKNVLETVGLTRLFKVYGEEAEGIASFK